MTVLASLLSTKLLLALSMATIGFSAWGTYLRWRLNRNWTAELAWQVQQRQMNMLVVWVALTWAAIVAEVLE